MHCFSAHTESYTPLQARHSLLELRLQFSKENCHCLVLALDASLHVICAGVCRASLLRHGCFLGCCIDATVVLLARVALSFTIKQAPTCFSSEHISIPPLLGGLPEPCLRGRAVCSAPGGPSHTCKPAILLQRRKGPRGRTW